MFIGEKDLVMGKTNTIIRRKILCWSILTGILGLFGFMALFTCVGCQTFRRIPQTGEQRREDLKPELATLIDEFRSSVPKIMKRDKIPGCALALVDDKGILWVEGFGTTDFKSKIPVTPNTLFYIGSISKTFTATAVLLAVQDGLLDLDEPITTYLPDFKVYSRYEEQPENKITLKHLLSHTSGLPHEVVECNMVEFEGYTLEDRFKGIDGLWLKYQVGQAFSYSNAGFDLAAYILQTVSGIPYEQYMTECVFRPLGMHHSTMVHDDIRRDTNRAIGHRIGFAEIPIAHGLLGAGGVWTDATDLAHFIQYFMNRGIPGGNHLLNESWLKVMLAPHARITTSEDEEEIYYGLGIGMNRTSGHTVLAHNGGGLGQRSCMYWCPKYGIGGLVLTNRSPVTVTIELELAPGRKPLREGRLKERYLESQWDYKLCAPPWTTWSEHAPSSYQSSWKQYCGTFRLRFGGFKLRWWAKLVLALDLDQLRPRIKIFEKERYLCLTESRSYRMDRQVNSRLMEVKLGVFYTASGDVLDFSGTDPTWRSYRFKKR